ncbi:MAG TPA: Gfo/Idh/MocA family oxidoreductase [Bryobacteraceae bacterium]|nr:Gfo/Idh/MocA family oxidoreductase [Bryobacteraceae bacterium]
MNRRQFVSTAAAGTLLAGRRVLGANDRIRIGLIGTGGRCMYLAQLLQGLLANEIVATCDAYEPRRLEAAQKMGPQAKPVADYREILDRNDIDAVVIGAPDHWHVPMAIDAVSAGKDVYVEKPVTHEISEGDKLIAAVEKSKRVLATGTQQRSWDHYILARQLIQGGRLGQITLAETYWYQNYIRPSWQQAEVDPSKLDWKKFLGSAPDQPFEPVKFLRWRFFWDFGGGIFTDLMTHWIDVVQWVLESPLPDAVQASGATYALHQWQCPDTVNASIQFPQHYTSVYNGTMISSLEDGGIVFRGSEGIMQLTREGFWLYGEANRRRNDRDLPEPEMVMKSTGDGTRTNLQNWLDCIRSRALPNAHVRAGVEAARTSHLTNLAMREGKIIRPSAT